VSDVVWYGATDDGYEAIVVRTAPYQGRLTVGKTSTLEKILVRDVSLAYDALFGPDADDVADWQEWASQAIEHRGG
jgi:hypothetical protein